MNSGKAGPRPDWRDRLIASVSPLGSGVRHLKVGGFRPANGLSFRPGRTAAVLVPLLETDEPQVILTRRAEHLPQHAGQISFPGGAAQHTDTSAVATALREAHEEIGLPIERARPIGFIDRLDTVSNYRVLPVVALVEPPVEWVVDPREVAEVISVPLPFAMDQTNYESRPMERDGRLYQIWYLHWRIHTIWGATAAILHNLACRYESARQV